jgi:hypothetical protein
MDSVKKVPQTIANVNLNLLTHSKGYLLRSVPLLNKCRFRIESYSPVSIFIVEHLTEAVTATSFSGQLIYPYQLIIKYI